MHRLPFEDRSRAIGSEQLRREPTIPTTIVKRARSNAAILMSCLPDQTDDFVDTPDVGPRPALSREPALRASPSVGASSGWSTAAPC
jgi:hypothetical protein